MERLVNNKSLENKAGDLFQNRKTQNLKRGKESWFKLFRNYYSSITRVYPKTEQKTQ